MCARIDIELDDEPSKLVWLIVWSLALDVRALVEATNTKEDNCV